MTRRKGGMFDQFAHKDIHGDGDIDFVSTRNNSDPCDGVFRLKQFRSKKARKAFKSVRDIDSKEMKLPLQNNAGN